MDQRQIRDALERQDVPVEVAALGGLLEVPEVADLHAWLRILGRPDDAPALMRILLGSRYRLGLGDLAPLARWVQDHLHLAPEADLGGVGWALLEAIDRLDECRFGDGEAELANEEHGGVTQCCQRAGPGADAAAILVEGDVAYMMMPVLDRLMGAVEFEETLGSGFLSRPLI